MLRDDDRGEAGTYTMLRRTTHEVAILYRQQPEARAAGAPPHWTSYISVEDADATAARAGELGGAAVFREPFDVLDAGRVAAISDPTGAIVNELATTDIERAETFFGEIRPQTEHERGIAPNWLPYFAVENTDDATRQAEHLGGRTISPATEIHIGRIAVIADLQGAAFAVLEGETPP